MTDAVATKYSPAKMDHCTRRFF